jgi:hypothetical protein
MTNLKIKAPQIIWIGFSVLLFAGSIALNGATYTEHVSVFKAVINIAFTTLILYWCGFLTHETEPDQPRTKPLSHFNIDD